MDTSKITLLTDLDIKITNFTIKVKLIRVWRNKWNNENKKSNCIHMILMDEQGTKFQATCYESFFSRFAKYLIEDECLFIYRPTLAENRADFKYIDNPHKISFYYNTFVKKCTNWQGCEYAFQFTDFKSITDQTIKLNAIIDVIGYVVAFSEMMDTVNKFGQDGNMMNIRLKDINDVEVTLTLWDDYAKQMDAYRKEHKDDVHVVVVVHHGRFKIYKGNETVQNDYHITRLFINTDLEDVRSFKKQFLENSKHETSSSTQSLSSSMFGSVEDIFLKDTHFSPIVHLGAIKEKKLVVIVGTIKSICNEKPWSYDGCNKCKSSVTTKLIAVDKEDGSGSFESKEIVECKTKSCNTEEIYAVPWFKIPIKVQDCTGSVSLTLFDREAFKFIRKSAKLLIERQEKLADFQEFPSEFEILIGKKLVFQIKIADYNLEHQAQFYGIQKLTADVNIICELEKKLLIYQVDDSESVGVSMSPHYQSNDDALKDPFSFTEDNVTPMSSLNEVNARTPYADLKRNLHQVYDADDLSCMSTTKTHKSEERDDGHAKVEQLLIPKLEK